MWACQRGGYTLKRPRGLTASATTSPALLTVLLLTDTGDIGRVYAEGGLDVLCAAAYTTTSLGRLAAVEIAHSCILNFPRSRTHLFHVGFDQALANAMEQSQSSVVREACMRTWMRLQPDRELLSSDTGRGSMYS